LFFARDLDKANQVESAGENRSCAQTDPRIGDPTGAGGLTKLLA
jgi:hypothetical protein